MHHRSPSLSPGNRYSGRGVVRSFPACWENCRNSSVTSAQTVCIPASSPHVSQVPVRKKPVIGSVEQAISSPPKTFFAIVFSVLDSQSSSLNHLTRFAKSPSLPGFPTGRICHLGEPSSYLAVWTDSNTQGELAQQSRRATAQEA